MPANFDTSNYSLGSFPSASTGFSNPLAVSGICGASCNFLLAMVGIVKDGNNPTGVTYNSVAMTAGPAFSYVNAYDWNLSLWYLASPPTGTSYSLSASFDVTPTAAAIGFVPMTGVNTTSPFGTAVTNGSYDVNANPSVSSVTGAGANDLYVGLMMNRDTTTSDGQTNIFYDSNINSVYSAMGSTLAGGSTQSFAWTGTGTVTGNVGWAALGVAILGATTPSLPGPFYYRRNVLYSI